MSTPAWTKLVNVVGTAPFCGLREFIKLILAFRACQAQRPFSQGKDRRQSRGKRCCSSFNICSHLVNQPACVKDQRSQPVYSVGSTCSRQVFKFQWLSEERVSAQPKRCASSPTALPKRGSEQVAFEIARSPHLVDEALSDYRRLTYTPNYFAAKTSRRTLWERLTAQLGHQPYPLTPVLVEKTSAVLRKAGYRSAYLYTCAAGDVPISEPTLLALQDVLQIVNDFLRFCTE